MSSVVRFRFCQDINLEAQQLLASLFAQLAQLMDGVSGCSARYEQASGEWVVHTGGSGAPLRVEQLDDNVVYLRRASQRGAHA